MLVEVVADKGKPVVIRFSDGSAEELPDCMDITDALAKLTEFVDRGKCQHSTIVLLLADVSELICYHMTFDRTGEQ